MRKEAPTNEIARERLRVVLENDRGFLNGKPLDLLKRDVAAVMQSYMEILESQLSVEFERGERGVTMVRIEVPAVKMRKIPGEIDIS